jgi:hypothetical protein
MDWAWSSVADAPAWCARMATCRCTRARPQSAYHTGPPCQYKYCADLSESSQACRRRLPHSLCMHRVYGDVDPSQMVSRWPIWPGCIYDTSIMGCRGVQGKTYSLIRRPVLLACSWPFIDKGTCTHTRGGQGRDKTGTDSTLEGR